MIKTWRHTDGFTNAEIILISILNMTKIKLKGKQFLHLALETHVLQTGMTDIEIYPICVFHVSEVVAKNCFLYLIFRNQKTKTQTFCITQYVEHYITSLLVTFTIFWIELRILTREINHVSSAQPTSQFQWNEIHYVCRRVTTTVSLKHLIELM